MVLEAKLDDVALQRLLQDLDDVLDGKVVDLREHLHEVDLLVRVIEGRIEQQRAPSAPATGSQATQQPLNPSGATTANNSPGGVAAAANVAPTCTAERTSPTTAAVHEGATTVHVAGFRRIWLLMTVMTAGRHLTWQELVEADLRNAAVVLDRRVKSRSARGAASPKQAAGEDGRVVPTPKMATQVATLQNLGNRIRRDLGKLAYHWHQDGQGVSWSADCQ
jgi:hypothetical protein